MTLRESYAWELERATRDLWNADIALELRPSEATRYKRRVAKARVEYWEKRVAQVREMELA